MHALRVLSVNHEDGWQAEGMMNAAELYSALALLAFQKLLEVYVRVLEPKTDEESLTSPKSSGQQAKARRGLQRLVAAGLTQYVVLVAGCNALELVAKSWNWAHPRYCGAALAATARLWFPNHEISLHVNATVVHNSRHTRESSLACQDLWNVVSLLMVVANFFTCSIALFAVLQYERTFADMLAPMRPFWKFWGVKGLLSVNFMQRIALMALGTLAPGGSKAKLSHEFRTFLNFYLVCIESAGLAALNACAYAPAVEISERYELRKLGSGAGSDADDPPQTEPLPEAIGRASPD
uniref:Uncharacterized protein n=1 Tax=Zooxanthella nutricula TaxID=1333877 RepID=A0A6U9L2E6_9DINO